MSAEQDILRRKIPTSLFAVAAIVATVNLIGPSTAKIVDCILYVIIPGIPMVLSVLYVKRIGFAGMHGKAWLAFSIAVTSSFIAEQMWMIYDKILHVDPWPSEADFFYFSFYVFFSIFSVFYIKPFAKSVNAKKITMSALVSLAIFMPTAIGLASFEKSQWDARGFDIIMGVAYPIADSIIMVPTMIAIMLFFEGKVGFLWTAIFVGILCFVVADMLFLMEEIDSAYNIGHPIDIGYFWAYVLFAFGVYHNMKYFEKPKARFSNPNDLR